MNLSKDVKVTVVSAAAVAAQTAVNSAIVDMSEYDGVMFLAVLDSAVSTSAISLKAQQNTLNQTTGMADITATGTATYTGTGSETAGFAFLVDVFRPQQRFVRAVLTRTTANAVVDCIIAIQYKSGKKPTVRDITVSASTSTAPT